MRRTWPQARGTMRGEPDSEGTMSESAFDWLAASCAAAQGASATYTAFQATLSLCAWGHGRHCECIKLSVVRLAAILQRIRRHPHRAKALEETDEVSDGNTIIDCAELFVWHVVSCGMTIFHVTSERMSCAEVSCQPESLAKKPAAHTFSTR